VIISRNNSQHNCPAPDCAARARNSLLRHRFLKALATSWLQPRCPRLRRGWVAMGSTPIAAVESNCSRDAAAVRHLSALGVTFVKFANGLVGARAGGHNPTVSNSPIIRRSPSPGDRNSPTRCIIVHEAGSVACKLVRSNPMGGRELFFYYGGIVGPHLGLRRRKNNRGRAELARA